MVAGLESWNPLNGDSSEKVIVSELETTLQYGRAATNINDLRSTVAAFARTSEIHKNQ